MLKAALKWLHSIPSEPDGQGSASRVGLLMVTGAICMVLVGHLYFQRRMPTHDELTGLAEIITASGGTYGVGKIMSALKG